MTLDNATLGRLSVDKPNYNRDEISIGIVHFGVGGFHRAHQAMYVDRLLEMGLAEDWGICGVGVMAADRKMAEVMPPSTGCTRCCSKPNGTRDARVIGSIVDYRYAPDDPESVIELLAAPSTRIISLTITEGGYNIDNLDCRRRTRVRSRRGGPGTSSRPRHRVTDDRLLRQHRGQRRRRPPRVHHLRRSRPSRPRRRELGGR